MPRDYGIFKDRIIDKLFLLPAFLFLTTLMIKKEAGKDFLICHILISDLCNHLYHDGGRDYVHENSPGGFAA